MITEMIMAMYLWIAPNMNVTVEQLEHMPQPKIEIVSQEFILEKATPGAIAFYDEKKEKDKIYISEKVDFSTNYGKSVLLHELIHYVQFTLETEYHHECDQKYERTAYTLQNKWMAEHGENEVMSEQNIKFLSFCFRHTDKL